MILFGLGCSFSYLVVIPLVLEFLYKYGEFVGIATFLDISQFVPFVLQFLLAFGISYQLPLLMWGLTISGLIRPNFWRNNLRYVIIILAIFGAIVTPDGSGITMWFVAGPMMLPLFSWYIYYRTYDAQFNVRRLRLVNSD